MYILKNERLRVEIQEPSEVEKITDRFDSTCFITEIVLDDSIYFAASEPHNMKESSTGGRGLCSEYRILNCDDEDTQWIPKPGVGLLRTKADNNTSVIKKENKQGFDFDLADLYDSGIAFKIYSKDYKGYAAETYRSIRLENNSIYMINRLKNMGTKEIIFSEYCHNFLSLDGMALGPDYSLEIPGVHDIQGCIDSGPDFNGTGSHYLYQVKSQTISPKHYSPSMAVFEIDKSHIRKECPFIWKISHKSSKVCVQGIEYFIPNGVCVWSYDHMICPEVSYMAAVLPGKEVFWKRQWIFEWEGNRK